MSGHGESTSLSPEVQRYLSDRQSQGGQNAVEAFRIRTSAMIFAEMQKEHEEARSRAGPKRRRIRGPTKATTQRVMFENSQLAESVHMSNAKDRDVGQESIMPLNESEESVRCPSLGDDPERRDRHESLARSLGLRTSKEIFDTFQKEQEARQSARSDQAQMQSARISRLRENGIHWVRGYAPGVARSRMNNHSGARAESDGPQGRPDVPRRRNLMYGRMPFFGLNMARPSTELPDRVGGIGSPAIDAEVGGSVSGFGEEAKLSSIMEFLQDEYKEKETLSKGRLWCLPVPRDRQISTVQDFYKAFHDTKTLPIHTCTICYRKYGKSDLKETEWRTWLSLAITASCGMNFGCRSCFPAQKMVLVCTPCIRELGHERLSPAAHLHRYLGCEHQYPEALNGLTLVEERLIALNVCYGLITKFSVSGGGQRSTKYPKHVKGHVTVFPNDVKALASNILPHPLLLVLEDIHVAWQGREKPKPSDLSALRSVRRRVVETALRWLKENNPLYSDVEIDVAEMDSWVEHTDGVPPLVYDRLEQSELSAREKVSTAQLVPPSERGLEGEKTMDIEEVLASLHEGGEVEVQTNADSDYVASNEQGADEDDRDAVIREISSSGMFALDGQPEVEDVEKLRYGFEALTGAAPLKQSECNSWTGSIEIGDQDGAAEPYILVSRGEDFADSFDTYFFARTFPTLFPFGKGGPRQAQESSEDEGSTSTILSRNMSLEAWARLVLQRHGGRFATHHVFSFLVFNKLVRWKNRQVSMMSVKKSNFPDVELALQSLSADKLQRARMELEQCGKTTEPSVNKLLRNLSLYGFRQPMSRELRLSMRRKIRSLIVRHGIPAIWFTLNPNDITNPVKLKLAAYRTRDPREAEAFLASLDVAYKRVRLAISDPLSSALFFHREIAMFFKYYVKVGEDSVFGRINQYFGAVETNERGALHLHGLLWLHGNMGLSSVLSDVAGEGQGSYKTKVTQYVDSVFTEDLDQEAFCAIQKERSVSADVSTLLQDRMQFSASFEEEANFCAGATQIHTHSPTCVKYSIGRPAKERHLCRFKAPWKLVEKTAFSEGGVLQIRRSHTMVNRWNKAIAVGLRHNHDISFIATQCKTMAIVFYVTNYATKAEDPIWKRVAAAAQMLESPGNGDPRSAPTSMTGESVVENKTRQFLMRVANRVFTERTLSQVEVVAHLLGYGTEFTNNEAWAFLNVSSLYWHVFRRWPHLREASGNDVREGDSETVLLAETGQRITLTQAYPHRGALLEHLSLYDYMTIVKLKHRGPRAGVVYGIPFEDDWPMSHVWVQVLRESGQHAVVCLDGFLSMAFSEEEEDDNCHRRAAVQHLAIFVPWERFLSRTSCDINDIWEEEKQELSSRVSFLVENVQLLRRSAEDVKRDAKQWDAMCGETDPAAELMDLGSEAGDDHQANNTFRSDDIGDAIRLIDIFRGANQHDQITTGSRELATAIQQLCRFQEAALWSMEDLRATMTVDSESNLGIGIPGQAKLRSIKSQQNSLSRERERMIEGIQGVGFGDFGGHDAAVYSVMNGFGEQDVHLMPTDSGHFVPDEVPTLSVQLAPSTSFSEAGRQLAGTSSLNRRQSLALLLVCRQLDRLRRSGETTPQLCQFVGGEGGTGKSRVIEAIVELFARKGISRRLLVTATSGTAAARINGITIHSACRLSKDGSHLASKNGVDQVQAPSSSSRCVDGRAKMDWQEKCMLIIDEVSMLGARTLYAVNEQLCMLRGSTEDFGGIPIVLFCGDFHQFRPVQERSILLSSADLPWDQEKGFRVEERYQHDKAHALWKKFDTVVILKEQVRAAGDPDLQRLLTRIRQGIQDQSDVDLLNSRCHRKAQRIPWESGITVVTPLNRNRWNLNFEATICFQKQRQAQTRIFISRHSWKDGSPSEEEAVMMLSQGDDSGIPIPAVFMFVPGMPIVVNQNINQGLKLVNGSQYTAVEVIVDKAYPGHRVSADMILHFGPPAGMIIAGGTTRDLHLVGMPPATMLLTPVTAKIDCVRKRPWQRHVASRRGLPCTAAFACTDYKVQGRTLDRVALELRGTRTMKVEGQTVASQCDPYSLYVQLSRCRTLDGIMLLSEARQRDVIGNVVPGSMMTAEKRLEELSERTILQGEAYR